MGIKSKLYENYELLTFCLTKEFSSFYTVLPFAFQAYQSYLSLFG